MSAAPGTDREQLLSVAQGAMKSAYAPYSKFQVGAAILLDDGRVFSGCNVENASYGLTICAERNAVFAAVAASDKKISITAVACVNSAQMHCSPCGACRQVLAEFSTPATRVFYQGKAGITEMTMGELLPDCFRM